MTADPIPFTGPAGDGRCWSFIARITEPYGEPVIIGPPIYGMAAARAKMMRHHRATGETYVLCPVMNPDGAPAPAAEAS